MIKKYVVQGAPVHCRYSMQEADRKLDTIDTAVKTGGKIFTTEADYEADFIGGGFGICTSPRVFEEYAAMMYKKVSNIQQLSKTGYIDEENKNILLCNYQPAFPWQNAHERVEIYGCRALLEDSWTFCTYGMGFITIDDHGQEGENPAEQIEKKLEALEKAVDQYMEDNGIDKKHRDDLLDSILLWNGYYILLWDYKSTEETRAFCSYLERENPALFNYFERGLYLPDGENPIDVTYMLGIYKGKDQGKDIFRMVNLENIRDKGMLSGYLEAYQIEKGKSTAEVLKNYLHYYQSPKYDRKSRYTNIVENWTDDMEGYCILCGYEPEKYDRKELALEYLDYEIKTSLYSNKPYDEGEAEEIKETFMKEIKKNMK